MAKRILLGIVGLILLAPLLMWLAWFFTQKKTLVVAIIDKRVLTTSGQEHGLSFFWNFYRPMMTNILKDAKRN